MFVMGIHFLVPHSHIGPILSPQIVYKARAPSAPRENECIALTSTRLLGRANTGSKRS